MLPRRECPQDGRYSVQVQICFGIQLLFRKNLVIVYGLFSLALERGAEGDGYSSDCSIFIFSVYLIFYATRGSLVSVVRGPRT